MPDRSRSRGRAALVATVALVERAKNAAMRRYRHYPNVVGISAGTKYVDGRRTDDHAAIHFYVTKKVSRRRCRGRALPRFVYGRRRNGAVDRRLKFATDVIEVGRVKMVCGAGSAVSSEIGLTRRNGRITLAFTNKAGSNTDRYIISCAHVIGDIRGAGAMDPTIVSDCSPTTTPFATRVFASQHHDDEVDYDIAVARVNQECPPIPDLEISGIGARIRAFMPTNEIHPPLAVTCALPVSNVKSAVVSSDRGSVSVEYEGEVYDVQNAWLMKADLQILEGDSGGLVYLGDVAIGVVFASSETSVGWAWFHPLVDAFEYMRARIEVDLRCFST